MQHRSYLYPVTLSVGCAVVCERCQTTIAYATDPAKVATIIADHSCTPASSPEVGR